MRYGQLIKRYRLVVCLLIGMLCGALMLLLTCGIQEWKFGGVPVRPSLIGWTILGSYGAIVGGLFGLMVGLVAKEPATENRRFELFIILICAMGSAGAAFTCVPFTIPEELLRMMTTP